MFSDWGIPPRQKEHYSQFKQQTQMKHVNEIALIQSVDLTNKLKEWNTDNEAFRVQLRIAYSAPKTEDESDENLLSLADFEEAGAAVSKTYTCLINFDSLLTESYSEKAQTKALETLKGKFEGKKARFSTYDYTITELTKGKNKVVNNGQRDYSSLANTYLGNVDDEENEFNKLVSRLTSMTEDGDFEFGSKDDE